MMIQRFYIISVLIIAPVFLCGCFETKTSYYYQPVNDAQNRFYAIQKNYEEENDKKTILNGIEFLREYPNDILAPAVHYYMASSYARLGKRAQARQLFQTIVDSSAEDEWKRLAKVNLSELGE